MMDLTMGIDVGQKREPTGICVAQSERRNDGGTSTVHFMVRHLERLPSGTGFPDIANRAAEVAYGVMKKADRPPVLYVDATGLGDPIVKLFKQKVHRYVRIVPVFFNHGDRQKVTNYPSEIILGKAWMTARLQTLLQGGCLHLPRSPETEILQQELLNFEIRIEGDANDRYGAFRVGTQDDLVTALGMAVQADRPVGFVISGALPHPPGW
jgi:hypothetical protein